MRFIILLRCDVKLCGWDFKDKSLRKDLRNKKNSFLLSQSFEFYRSEKIRVHGWLLIFFLLSTKKGRRRRTWTSCHSIGLSMKWLMKNELQCGNLSQQTEAGIYFKKRLLSACFPFFPLSFVHRLNVNRISSWRMERTFSCTNKNKYCRKTGWNEVDWG